MEHYQHYPIVDNIQSTPEHVHTVFVFMEMGLEARGSQLGEFCPQGTFGDGCSSTPPQSPGQPPQPGVTWKQLGAHPPHPLALILLPNTATRRVGYRVPEMGLRISKPSPS